MNKKLIKTIASITCGLGIVGTIPAIASSCGGQSETEEIINPLPEDVYNIDQNNVLKGFTSEFLDNPSAYSDCNTMLIPASVTSIVDNAFYHNYASTIPSFIKKVTFAKGSKCNSIGSNTFAREDYSASTTTLILIDLSKCSSLTTIGSDAFRYNTSLASITFPSSLESIGETTFGSCRQLISVTFPSSLKTIGAYAFIGCNLLLNNIKWNAWAGNTTLDPTSFSGVCRNGIVTVTNPIDDEHNSAALLAYLKQYGGLPDSWKY